VPGDRRVALIRNTGVRSYEAQLILEHAGITETYNLQGGMTAVRKRGVDL